MIWFDRILYRWGLYSLHYTGQMLPKSLSLCRKVTIEHNDHISWPKESKNLSTNDQNLFQRVLLLWTLSTQVNHSMPCAHNCFKGKTFSHHFNKVALKLHLLSHNKPQVLKERKKCAALICNTQVRFQIFQSCHLLITVVCSIGISEDQLIWNCISSPTFIPQTLSIPFNAKKKKTHGKLVCEFSKG